MVSHDLISEGKPRDLDSGIPLRNQSVSWGVMPRINYETVFNGKITNVMCFKILLINSTYVKTKHFRN